MTWRKKARTLTTPTPQDVQAKLDLAFAELTQTTVGYLNSHWKTPPTGTHWANALADIAAARAEAGLLLPPATPPPPPPSTGSWDTVVPTLTYAPVAAASPTNYTSLSSFLSALGSLQPGQWIRGVGLGTIPGNFVWNHMLSSPARVSFDSGCHFTGTAVSGSPSPGNVTVAIYMSTSTNLQLVFEPGSTVTNPGGTGIMMHGGTNVVLDGFVVSGCGANGLSLFPASDGGPISGCFVRGEAYNIGLTHGYDPHAEKGTGLHCMNVADTGYAAFHDNTIAVYGHDCTFSGGSVIEIGDPSIGPYSNTFYIKAANMLFKATSQTGGNGVNLWGTTAAHDNDFKVIEATNMMGRAVDCQGVSSGSFANVRVEYGRAFSCCQNPNLGSTESGVASTNPWDPRHGVAYSADVTTV